MKLGGATLAQQLECWVLGAPWLKQVDREQDIKVQYMTIQRTNSKFHPKPAVWQQTTFKPERFFGGAGQQSFG